MTGEELREKDREVLRQIADGNNDVQKITSATTLENHEVNYCFTKLQNLDLIQVEKPGGRVTREINGQRRNFQAPKTASITSEGQQLLEETSSETQHRNLTQEELVDKIHSLENRVSQLENQLNTFKQQFQNWVQ